MSCYPFSYFFLENECDKTLMPFEYGSWKKTLLVSCLYESYHLSYFFPCYDLQQGLYSCQGAWFSSHILIS